MRSEIESRWLGYARHLVLDATHIEACNALLGAEARLRGEAPDLRWPGYLGASFPPGGLLLVATVHREFESGPRPLRPEQRDALVDTTRAWRDGLVDDDAWLNVVRNVYSAGLTSHWTVGRLLRALNQRIGLDVAQVAYANAARCQVVEGPPPLSRAARIKRNVVAYCTKQYPISELAALIGAGAVIVTKGTYDCAAAGLRDGPPLFVVDQRQLCLRADLDVQGRSLHAGTLIESWAGVLGQVLERSSKVGESD